MNLNTEVIHKMGEKKDARTREMIPELRVMAVPPEDGSLFLVPRPIDSQPSVNIDPGDLTPSSDL